MGIQLRGGQEPGPNDPCLCGSNLKYKHCHGDPTKRALCNNAANKCMAELVQQEQKRRGLIPYNYKCKHCTHGFDEPERGVIAPHLSMCPLCGSTDIEENKNESGNIHTIQEESLDN